MYQNESFLSQLQIHFLRSLLDGKREISEAEADARSKHLHLNNLSLPCAVICISPYYTSVDYQKKDELIKECCDYVCKRLERKGYRYYALTNSYDNIQILLPTAANDLSEKELDEVFILLRDRFYNHFELELFIGIGSVVDQFSKISRSALEAMEMLAFKHQYADRGVINIVNTTKFRHYSVYGEDIMFARVIGRFQDGDLPMMAARLDELIDSIRHRPYVSKSAIKRTFVELAVNLLHIAANADVDVDAVLENVDPYSWIMAQNHTEVLSEWLMNLSAKLLEKMNVKQETDEKEIIRQACDYVASHLGETDLSLQSVSEAVGLSAAYFSQMFKVEKGVGLNNFITDCRIVKAQELLRATDLKGEDIALQLGFTTPTYFGRVFKKQTGFTPSAYRKRTRLAQEKGTTY